MSDDKIAEIRARHALSASWSNGYSDRATLLAEVDRLRADLITHQNCCDGAAAQDAHIRREREEHRAEIEKHRAENERLQAENKILFSQVERLADLLPNPCEEWYSVFAEKMVKERDAARAEVEKMRAEIERLREALEYIVNVCPAIDPDGHQAHERARKALEGKP